MVVNHPVFADDMCVFSPSISGLQYLRGDYAAEHEIAFNCNKTIGVLFRPQNYKAPRHFRSVPSCSKKTLYFVPIACQCRVNNCGANTHRLV